MTKKEADKIVEKYKPHKGFFDLSMQPKELSNIEYAKILISIHASTKGRDFYLLSNL